MSSFDALSANSQDIKKFQVHQKARSLLIVVVIGVPVFLAMLAYLFYQDAIKSTQNNITNPENQSIAINSSDPSGSIGSLDPSQVPTSGSPGVATGPAYNPGQANQGVENPSQGTTTQPSNKSIPAGVESAINSIESNGIKGSPYVSSNLDTSQVPTGTSITFDRSSWVQYSDNVGSVKVKLSVMGMAKTGSVTFSIEGGAWKATGYNID